MKNAIFMFGGLSVAVWLLFELSKFSLLSQVKYSEVYIISAGCLFILIGYLLNKLFRNEKDVVASTPRTINQDHLEKTGLTSREYQVLTLMSQGLSNKEIGQRLFVSENTVKTHVSKTLAKLNAKRRTQAVQIARDLSIL